MEQKLRIEGIYDQRTLKYLKERGVKDFCFDFSPVSFNFVQEYVFLDQILNLLDSSDRIFLHFTRSNDPMVNKLAFDLEKAGRSLENIFFEFDEWSNDVLPSHFNFNFLINFSKEADPAKLIGPNFKGFVFNFDYFEEMHRLNLLTNFATNFYTRYHSRLPQNHLMLLRINWHSNLLASLFDLFEFNLLSFPINSSIEVCYRNVDLKKLNSEMDILKKSTFLFQGL